MTQKDITQELFDRLTLLTQTPLDVGTFDDQYNTGVYFSVGRTGLIDISDLCEEFRHVVLAGQTMGVFD